MVIAKVAGLVLAAKLGYLPLFLFAGFSYLLAYGAIQLLMPRLPLEGVGSKAVPQPAH
jgi:ACS family hexuronate transporter-like MFS transporter